MEICELLKEYRIQKGISQRELGERVGLSQQAIALIEQGKRKLDINLFLTLLSELGSSYEDIVKILNALKKDEIFMVATDKKGEYISLSDRGKYIDCYDNLNSLGKKEALKRVEELTEIKRYTVPDTPSEQRTAAPAVPDVEDTENLPEHLVLRAAHARTDIEVTEEMKKHDDDIMNDDKLWK